MVRIQGVTRGGSPLARIAFFMSRRKLGKVVRPLTRSTSRPRASLGVFRTWEH